MAGELTKLQKLFVDYYLDTENEIKAAILAGYSYKKASLCGKKNLENPRVSHEIEVRREERATRKNAAAETASVTKLTDVIAPAFYTVHWDIIEGNHTYYDLFGGRGSTKSSFIGTEIVLGIMSDPLANAIIYRKVGNTIGNSVYEQILWSIEALGVRHLWKARTSPHSFTYLPTGQVIVGWTRRRKRNPSKLQKAILSFSGLRNSMSFRVRKKYVPYSNPCSVAGRNLLYSSHSTLR